jgi:tousled-like kinase
VDVWSVGVIFFQMLFGRRPFGEGQSQEQVLNMGIIRDAKQVNFPLDAKAPKTSPEAQAFIKACLTHDQRLRPDIKSLCLHSYLLHHK